MTKSVVQLLQYLIQNIEKMSSKNCRRCRILKPLNEFEELAKGKISLACIRCLTSERASRKRIANGERKKEWYWNGHLIRKRYGVPDSFPAPFSDLSSDSDDEA